MTTLTVNTSATGGYTCLAVGSGLAVSNRKQPIGIPAFVRADEAYYWSAPWQNGVREALAARKAGDSVRFDSGDPNDVLRWLFDVDDES
jgi:hypothetical protein